MRITQLRALFWVIILGLLVNVQSGFGAATHPVLSKLDPRLAQQPRDEPIEFLIILQRDVDLSPAYNLPTKLAKGEFVYQSLRHQAEQSQKRIWQYLDHLGIAYRPFWIVNMIWVRGNLTLAEKLTQFPEVSRILPNPQIQVSLPTSDATPTGIDTPTTIEWNILKIRADEVWNLGYRGQGVVIGGADTGYEWTHPALKNQYRGWNGTYANHNYNWHDAITVTNTKCPGNSPEPCDDYGHGTHTMGIAVGDDGGIHQIGVAPDAKWIGCRNMNNGVGTPESYIACYEWFVAPYPINGDAFTDGDPSQAPDIITNSWTCPPNEGCDAESLRDTVEAVYAAGILSVHSAGNEGNWGCSSIQFPAAIYPESFTVGATDSSDVIASFSSKGPVTIDGSNLLKPDISAPGVSIKSSFLNGSYTINQGTSMAAPHVAGLAALMLSADPSFKGQVSQIRSLIEQNAIPLYTYNTCGGDTPTSHPNHTYGWGRIDALNTLNALPHHLTIAKSAEPPITAPAGIITYTLNIHHTHPSQPATGIVISDTLPSGTTFITSTQPFIMDNDIIKWNYSALEANKQISVTLVVQNNNPAGSVINQSYSAATDQTGPIHGEPLAVPIIPYSATLSIIAPPTTYPNGTITYTIQLTNTHPTMPLHHVIISDTIPTGTTFLSATTPYTLTSTAIMWQRKSLPAHKTWIVTFTLHIPSNTLPGYIVNDTYGMRSDEISIQNNPPVTTEVHMLSLEKWASTDLALYQQPLTYTLEVVNRNPISDAHKLILTDTLPEFSSFITATQPFTITGNQILWHLDTLPPEYTWQVNLVVAPTSSLSLVNANYASASLENPEPVWGKPVSTIVQKPDIAISPGTTHTAFANQILQFSHTITNTGNYTDTMFIQATSSHGWSFSPPPPPFTLLAPNESYTLPISVLIPASTDAGTQAQIIITITSASDISISETAFNWVYIYSRIFLPLVK